METALYRIAQEALTNVAKHARAQHVSVVVTRRHGSVTILVEDDGRGFGARGGEDDGLGLVGMRERVGLLGGRLAIESTEGSGTTIVAEVPLR
jgi:signal transduction histidine kinase